MNKIEELFGLKSGDVSRVLLEIGINIALAAVILIVGFWLAKMLSRAVEKLMIRGNSEKSLTSFIKSLVSGIIRVLVIVTAITQLGIEMTSFVAILGAAGLAVGMAFSGTLSNFAGGVIILAFKPFKSGDYIVTQGMEGIVSEVLIFHTHLKTSDNKVVILPNGAVANGVVTNLTRSEKRRVDWKIAISYGDDLKLAKDLINKYLQEDKRIIKKPEPVIALVELGPSSVNITVRAWAKTADYWNVFFDLNERIYKEFAQEGINLAHTA